MSYYEQVLQDLQYLSNKYGISIAWIGSKKETSDIDILLTQPVDVDTAWSIVDYLYEKYNKKIDLFVPAPHNSEIREYLDEVYNYDIPSTNNLYAILSRGGGWAFYVGYITDVEL